jgi:ABC-2 type transport system ATP-binding protein
MIEFNGVTKLYKTVIGVNDITMRLKPGAYGLLGPNGSGKTTFINLIMGQLRPTLGAVRLFGEDPWNNDSIRNRVGLCPAIQASYPIVTGFQWVNFLTRLRGFSRAEARDRTRQAMERVGMLHAMDRAMSGYSLGMRQRTVLAQALSHEPELLILDEPFNGLDPKGRFEMAEFFRNWIRSGRSLILASHILHEVETLRPSLLLISGGRLLASGSPEEVRSFLADCPNSIRIKCNTPRRLAALAMERWSVDRVRIGTDDELELESRSPLELLTGLPEVALENGLVIHELRSADESLQDIFRTLMRIHRGELRSTE